jgi:hypothetical protein
MKYSDFYHLPVKPDGACFFNAISGIFHLENKMKKVKGKTITYKIDPKIWLKESLSLRLKCVQWLQNNPNYVIKDIGTNIKSEILEDLNYNDNITDKTLKGYFNYMKKIKGYAGQIEIYAISEIFQRNIRTFIDKNGQLSNVGLGYEIVPKNIMNDIYIYHNLGDVGNETGIHHYEILFPKNKATIVSKSIYMKQNTKSVKSISKKKKITKKLSSKRIKKRTKTKRNTQRNIKRNITPIRKRKYSL